MGHADFHKKGDWNALCDVCGFKYKASELKKTWDGYYVCPQDFELRHPQELIRSKTDDQSVPWTRPEPDWSFVELPYTVNSVNFDGSTNLARGADLTGNTDGKKGIFSAHVTFNADGSNSTIWRGGTTDIIIERLPTNKIRLTLTTSGGGQVLRLTSSSTYQISDGQIWILASWDLGASLAHLYINDVDDEDGTTVLVDNTINYTSVNHYPGGVLFDLHDGCMSELVFNMAEYLDITIDANRRLIAAVDGSPVNKGSDGRLITGTPPIVYLNGDSTDFQINQGTGGNFTITGALTACPTTP